MSNKDRENLRTKVHNQYVKYKKDACERCGKQDTYMAGSYRVKRKVLTVHHRDRDIENNVPENLETLCQKCHQKEHENDNLLKK